MQETTVPFEPIYEGQLGWFVKLFVIYLSTVLIASAFRAVRLVWRLRCLRKMEREGADKLNAEFQFMWNSCHAKSASIKSLSALTFLLSVLVCAWRMTEILRGVSMEKVTGTAFLAGASAQVLTLFSLGILVCAVLYAFVFFYDTVLWSCRLGAARPK